MKLYADSLSRTPSLMTTFGILCPKQQLYIKGVVETCNLIRLTIDSIKLTSVDKFENTNPKLGKEET